MKHKFVVKHVWSSKDDVLQAGSGGGYRYVNVNPMAHNFRSVDEAYLIEVLDDSRRVKVTSAKGYETEGVIINDDHSHRSCYYDRSRMPIRQYRMGYSMGGTLSIFEGGFAELAVFGSGLPVLSIKVGQLEAVRRESHYCCRGGLVYT